MKKRINAHHVLWAAIIAQLVVIAVIVMSPVHSFGGGQFAAVAVGWFIFIVIGFFAARVGDQASGR